MFRFSYLLSLWVNSALLLSDDLSLNKLRPTIQCIERTEPKLTKPNAIHFQTDHVYQMSTRKWSCQVNERIGRRRELITFGKSKDGESAHQWPVSCEWKEEVQQGGLNQDNLLQIKKRCKSWSCSANAWLCRGFIPGCRWDILFSFRLSGLCWKSGFCFGWIGICNKCNFHGYKLFQMGERFIIQCIVFSAGCLGWVGCGFFWSAAVSPPPGDGHYHCNWGHTQCRNGLNRPANASYCGTI